MGILEEIVFNLLKLVNSLYDLNYDDFYFNDNGITRNGDFELIFLRCNKLLHLHEIVEGLYFHFSLSVCL